MAPKPNGHTVVIATRLSPALIQFITTRAAENDRSTAAELRHIVKADFARTGPTNGRGARQDASPQSSVDPLGHDSV
jgi:hypothetical protein